LGSDEHALVIQAQAGDQRAFQELVSRYQRRVYAIARGMVRNGDDAMDITQDAFIKVHRHLDRFKGTSSFYTWLYRIVVNLCIDHLRRANKSRAVDFDDTRAHEQPAELAPRPLEGDPLRSLRRQELRQMVERALEMLTAKHRAVILMREVQGLSYTEMAEAMACSKGTIMSRLFHARRRMQQALLAVMGREAVAEIVSGKGLERAELAEQTD